MTAPSKACVGGFSLAGIVGSWGHGRLLRVSVVCGQVEVSASGRSLVQRSPAVCSVSEGALAHWGLSRHGKKNSTNKYTQIS